MEHAADLDDTQPEQRGLPSACWALDVLDAYGVRRFEIREGETIEVGKAAGVAMQIVDPLVSSRHCRVTVAEGRLSVADVGSRNGVFAAGSRIARGEVEAGGCFVVGQAVITCQPSRGSDVRELLAEAPLDGVIGESVAMRRLAREVRRLAGLRAPVLVRGETGAGKELVAAAIHRSSPRRDRTFHPLNMGALPGELADAELFGHERGAYTGASVARPGAFELAKGGTLFLDEIAELAMPVQAKLLRALEGGEVRAIGAGVAKKVDVRIVAATWAPLDERVESGQFREDLFHRLAVLTIEVPPLRDRKGDIALLARAFLAQYASEIGPRVLSTDGLSRLLAHDYPGNVRELRNVLLRAATKSEGRVLTAEHVGASITTRHSTRPPPPSPMTRDRSGEARAIVAHHGGNISSAARALGVARSTVREWVRGKE